MAFTNAWDEDRPLETEEANTADDYFRDHRVDLGDRLEDMFYGFNASSNSGNEGGYGIKQIRYKEQASAPNLTSDEIREYSKLVNGQAELFFKDEAGNEKQRTSGGKINVLDADGVVMKSGNQTVAGQKTFSGACTFSTASTLADSSQMASDAAPTSDADISNKKYVDDQVATKPTAGLAKAWCSVASDGTLGSGSYNITSSAKDSTGTYTITWDTNFGDTNYVVVVQVTGRSQGVNTRQYCSVDDKAAGTVVLNFTDHDGSATDNAFDIIAFGTQ